MSWAQRQTQTYPPDEGVRIRLMWMPTGAPPRPRPPKPRRPVKGCEDCAEAACQRHSYDVMASVGVAPAGPRSPDEFVTDWRPV